MPTWHTHPRQYFFRFVNTKPLQYFFRLDYVAMLKIFVCFGTNNTQVLVSRLFVDAVFFSEKTDRDCWMFRTCAVRAVGW